MVRPVVWRPRYRSGSHFGSWSISSTINVCPGGATRFEPVTLQERPAPPPPEGIGRRTACRFPCRKSGKVCEGGDKSSSPPGSGAEPGMSKPQYQLGIGAVNGERQQSH